MTAEAASPTPDTGDVTPQGLGASRQHKLPVLAAILAFAGVAGALFYLRRRRPGAPSLQETQLLEVHPAEAHPPQARPLETQPLDVHPPAVDVPPPDDQPRAAPGPAHRARTRVVTGAPSRLSIIGAIVAKDLAAFSRDKFWGLMTILSLVWIVGMYYFLPDTVNESITIGVHQTDMDALFDLAFEGEEGIEWVKFESTEELEAALGLSEEEAQQKRSWLEVALGRGEEEPEQAEVEKLDIGIDFPAGFLASVAAGEVATVTVYVDAAVPVEIRNAISSFVREGAYALTGNELPVRVPEEQTIILGEDRLGRQVALRDKMRPFYAFIMLLMETFALGTLIAEEVSSRSVTAILVTPARISDFLAAKGIVGTAIAFTEAVLVMLLVRSFDTEPVILAVTLLLGAVLVTGIALIAGASGRDYIGMAFYSMLFLIPLLIPLFAALFPGTASAWVKALPTYGLVQVITGVASYGYGWTEAMPHLVTLAAWCVVAFGVGLVVLRRKVESL